MSGSESVPIPITGKPRYCVTGRPSARDGTAHDVLLRDDDAEKAALFAFEAIRRGYVEVRIFDTFTRQVYEILDAGEATAP